MANGRCRRHGGKGSGAPRGNKNARTHGFYDASYSDEEKRLVGKMTLGSVDEELRVARIQLRRAVITQKRWQDNPDDGFLPTTELVDDEVIVGGEDGALQPKQRRTKKLPDFDAIINRLIGRIGDLERIRSEIGGGLPSDGAVEAARNIREAIGDIDGTVPPAPPKDSGG